MGPRRLRVPAVGSMHGLADPLPGGQLPDDLKLSKKAVRQVYAIREWAARENKNRQGAFEAELATPTPPQAARVEAVRSACVPPAAQAFVADPATIARAAQLMRGPRLLGA